MSLCCSEGFRGNFFKLVLNINIKSRRGGGRRRRQEAVSKRAKWREADSPGRGRGVPTASIRQGRVTSVGAVNGASAAAATTRAPARAATALRSQPGALIPCGCKDDTPGEQIQHLTLKKIYIKTKKILYQIRLHQKRPSVTLKQGSFTAVGFFFPFEGECVWSLMLVNSKFTTGI